MTDFLDEKLKEIRDRLDELRPVVEEFRRLEAAERALTGLDGAAPSGGRPAPAADAGPSGRGRGRPPGDGSRSKQALELVRARPGITIPELAETMQIKQNYLYRVMPSLAEQGLVHKSGRGWHIRGGAPAADDDE